MQQLADFDLGSDNSFARDGSFSTSTPRNTRSVSYLDITHSYERDGMSLSVVSMERMRSLSQSISDLNIMREKQMGRRHEVSVLLEDNFLTEHARKLHEARKRIKALEAKYSNPKRRRSHSNPSSGLTSRDLEKKRLQTANMSSDGGGFAPSIANENQSKTNRENKDKIVAKCDEARLLCTAEQENSLEENNKDESDSGILADKGPPVNVTQTRRPLTWAFDDGWRDEEGATRSRPGYTDLNGSAGHNVSNANICEKQKWQSMPNLDSNDDNFPQDQQMMYGEAIPVDQEANGAQRKKKRGWRSSTYVVNTSTVQESGNEKRKKKHKFRIKFFHKKSSLKKCTLKISAVGAPKEAQPIGRILGAHSETEHAYTVELRRPESGSYGFHLQNGYNHIKKGVFVSKISDKKAQKFLGGFIHVGDEVLEINSKNIQDQNYSTANKLLTSSEKLSLTILPYSTRSDR